MKKIIAIFSVMFVLTACNASNSENNSQESNLTTQKMTTFSQKASPQSGEKIAILTTNFGDIKIRLFSDQAPETAKNFIELTAQDKYEDVIFHRIVPGFVIQGGDFEKGNGTGGYSYKGLGTKIKNEISPDLSHIQGAVSMANAGPDTNGSQFFIVLPEEGTDFLDGNYSIFGQVYEGMEVVQEMAQVETDQFDMPLSKVLLQKVEIQEVE